MRTLDEAIDEILESYMDEDLQVTVDRNPSRWSTGNGLMHLGFTLCMIKGLHGNLDASDDATLKAYDMCEVAPGLYSRNPGRGDLIAQDDLIGVAAGAVAFSDPKPRANEILSYGLRHLLFWNNTSSFTFAAFRGRFLSFMLYLLGVTTFWFSPAFRPLTWLYLKLSKPSSYSVILEYMMLESLAKVSPMFKNLRNDKVRSMGLLQATVDYFGETHPLVDLARLVEESKI